MSLKAEKVKIDKFLRETISTCGKYKIIIFESAGKNMSIITKPTPKIKNKEINAYLLSEAEQGHYISKRYISLEDFDEWICEEWGGVIQKFFFIGSHGIDYNNVYLVRCIDGDNNKTAVCLNENSAISLFYSECIDREIRYEFTHSEYNPQSYKSDEEDRFVRIWIDRTNINKWMED